VEYHTQQSWNGEGGLGENVLAYKAYSRWRKSSWVESRRPRSRSTIGDKGIQDSPPEQMAKREKRKAVFIIEQGFGRRQPSEDITWQQIYFCLRTGYYDEARSVAQSSRVSQMFSPQLAEWISSGGMVSAGTTSAVAKECERMLRMGDM